MYRKELNSSLKYFQETVRTGKVEMLAGSANMILQALLKLLNVLNFNFDSNSTKIHKLGDAIVGILQYADERVSEQALKTAEGEKSNLADDKDTVAKLVCKIELFYEIMTITSYYEPQNKKSAETAKFIPKVAEFFVSHVLLAFFV